MAASFAITAHTAESLTVTVSGVAAGDEVRFFLRREDDPDTMLYIVSYLAASTTCVRTFPPPAPGDEYIIYDCEYKTYGVIPLLPNTGYAVNIRINDGDYLGGQYVTTDYTDHIVDIPILSSDFALFDWADWPDSKAALVSGEYTHKFKKEAWNAIVDHLAAALNAAGIKWDSLYTPTSAAKITQVYGSLYAAVFNSVRHNIDFPMPLGWAWAENPNFRGYVGREDFRGVSIWGESRADDVYAEYIPELVRKLNLLIEVMKGDKAVLIAGRGNGYSLHTGYIIPRLSVPVESWNRSFSIDRSAARACPPVPLSKRELMQSGHISNLLRFPSAVLGRYADIIRSGYKATAKRTRAGNLGGHEYILKSLMAADMDIYNARPISAKWLSRSKQGGTMAQVPPMPMSAEWLSASRYTATGALPSGLLLVGEDKSASVHGAEIAPVEARPMAAAGTAKTAFSAVPFKLGIAPIEFGEKVVSIHSAALKRAIETGGKETSATLVSAVLYLKPPGPVWYDPEQTGSNLYIRSVWSSWSDAGNLQIDTVEFYAPVRDGSDLYIRSAWFSYQDQNEVSIDLDVFYKPVKTGSDLYIQSVNNFWTDGNAGNVDTDYFLDPVQTGSNLYIRSDVLGG